MTQYSHRLQRDIRELSAHNFDCSASNVIIVNNANTTQLSICIRDGPYANAHYTFSLITPDNFPFKCPQIISTVPIWHPNIELHTGIVTLPIEWSPDLRLVDLAINLQLLMLSPSDLAVSNIEASITYQQDPTLFKYQIRLSLLGGVFFSMDFPPIVSTCECCRNTPHTVSSISDMHGQYNYVSNRSPCISDDLTSAKRARKPEEEEEETYYSSHHSADSFEMPVLSATTTYSHKRNRQSEEPLVEVIPKLCKRASWDTCSNGHDLMSYEEDTTPCSRGMEAIHLNEDEMNSAEWIDNNDYDMYGRTSFSGSYRTYNAKTSLDIENHPVLRHVDLSDLPILRHLPTINRQIARSNSLDEWDDSIHESPDRSGRESRQNSIFRRSSVFAHNNAIFEAEVFQNSSM